MLLNPSAQHGSSWPADAVQSKYDADMIGGGGKRGNYELTTRLIHHVSLWHGSAYVGVISLMQIHKLSCTDYNHPPPLVPPLPPPPRFIWNWSMNQDLQKPQPLYGANPTCQLCCSLKRNHLHHILCLCLKSICRLCTWMNSKSRAGEVVVGVYIRAHYCSVICIFFWWENYNRRWRTSWTMHGMTCYAEKLKGG